VWRTQNFVWLCGWGLDRCQVFRNNFLFSPPIFFACPEIFPYVCSATSSLTDFVFEIRFYKMQGLWAAGRSSLPKYWLLSIFPTYFLVRVKCVVCVSFLLCHDSIDFPCPPHGVPFTRLAACCRHRLLFCWQGGESLLSLQIPRMQLKPKQIDFLGSVLRY